MIAARIGEDMELPLVEEIREARRLAEEAQDATVHYQQVQTVIASLGVLQRQAASLPSTDVTIPGGELVEAMSERWSALADLPTIGPRPTQELLEQLRMRRQQMESASQLLQPIVEDAERRSGALHQLQHQQGHLLEDPKYSEQVAELQRLANDRAEARSRLDPLHHRLKGVEPAYKVVSSFAERLDDMIREEMALPGAAAWRAALVARDLVSTLDGLLAELRLDVPHPAPLEVPDTPDPAHADELLDKARGVKAELDDLVVALKAEHEHLRGSVDALQERYDELTQQIVDRMG